MRRRTTLRLTRVAACPASRRIVVKYNSEPIKPSLHLRMSTGVKRDHWENAHYAIGKSSFSRCVVDSCGTFIIVRPLSVFSTPPPFLLFIADYSPIADPGKDPRKMHLIFKSDSETAFSFRFETEQDKQAFTVSLTKSVTLFRAIADADGSHSNPFDMKTEVMWPSGKIESCKIIVCPLTGTFRIDAAAESTKMFLDSIYCAPLVTKVKAFKRTEHTDSCFLLKDNTNNDLYIFACNSQEAVMQVVLVVHVFNYKEHKKRVITQNEHKDQIRQSGENDGQEVAIAFEDIIGEEIEAEDEPAEKAASSPRESAAPEEKKPVRVSTGKKDRLDGVKKTAVRKNLVFMEQEKVEREKPTFLKDNMRTHGTVAKKFEELEKTIPTLKCQASPIDLPKVSSISVAVEETVDSSVPKMSDEDQVMYAMEMLPDLGDDPVKCFTHTTEKSNEQIVEEETAPKPEMPDVDLSTLVKLRDFPEFKHEQYKTAFKPANPIVMEFMNATQAILEEGGSEYNEVRFTILVACVLANGMVNKGKFLEAYSEFSKFVPELDKVLEDARGPKSTWAQIARFCEGLVNKGIVVSLLKRCRYNNDWIAKYFVNTALIYNDESVQAIIDLVIPIMMSVQFAVPMKDDMISGGPFDVVFRFLQVPAFSHLSLVRYLQPDYKIETSLLIRYLSSVLTSHLCRKNALAANAEKKWSYAFDYIVKVVNSRPNLLEKDYLEMVEITKTLSNANSSLSLLMNANITALLQGKENALEKWITAGINARKIHKWFFYIISNPELSAPYFWEESAIRDPYRQRYVLSHLTEIVKRLPESQ